MNRWFLLFCLMLLTPTLSFATEKEWTFMVFLNADNNLDEYGVLDQEEMTKIGSSDRLNIVVLIDRYRAPASLNFIQKGKVIPLADPVEVDMGDYHQLVAFTCDMIKRYPARHYALVVWNHGAGWKKKGPVLKGISYDDSSNNHITTHQLGEALAEIKQTLGHNLDLFCMDACLMQMFEVAWQIRNSCDYIVASEETVPGDGYPYEQVLGGLVGGMTPEEFGKHIVKVFRDSYNHNDGNSGGMDDLRGVPRGIRKTTMSLLDCQRLSPAKEALDAFAQFVMAGDFTTRFRTALKKTQTFAYADNIDLIDFLLTCNMDISDPGFREVSNRLIATVRSAVLANATTGTVDSGDWSDDSSGDDLRQRGVPVPLGAHGLAVYFPQDASDFLPEYLNLSFAKDSFWDDMVQDFYRKTSLDSVIADLRENRLESLQNWAGRASMNPGSWNRYARQRIAFELFCGDGHSERFLREAAGLFLPGN